jgi:hypothetical protein
LPNARRFQVQTCSVSCEDFKNIYIWYPDQDQSIEIRDRNFHAPVFHTMRIAFITYFKIKVLKTFYRVFSPRA